MAALTGVRILDLSQMIGAPYCTQVLGDLGADVIKVEEPTTALLTRVALSPPGVAETRRFSGYWLATNRNKRSVTLDLKVAEARGVLTDLVRRSDVVVENFGSHPRASLGITEEWGFSVRPDLVWACLTGYGRSGPDSGRDGWDLVAQARGGLLDMTGDPEGPPMKAGNSAADYLAGLHLAVGILAALHHRAATGEGQVVDVSLLEPVLACLDGLPMWHSVAGVTPKRNGNFHPARLPAYSVFPAEDGYVVIGAAGASFARLMQLLGRPELGAELPPADAGRRAAWFDEVVTLIRRWSSERTRDRIQEELDAHDVPNEAVRDLAEVWADPQLEARGSYLEYDYPPLGRIRAIGNPIHLSRTPTEVRHVPPAAGQHNDDVLRGELGYGDEQIDRLVQAGAIWGGDPSAT